MSAKIDLGFLRDLDGFIAAALVDVESGLALATEDASGGSFNLEIAAAGNKMVYNAKLKVASNLGINEDIEDILISFGHSYHLLRTLHNDHNFFFYLVLDREKANLAMARHELKNFS